jgi:hypothetical protein
MIIRSLGEMPQKVSPLLPLSTRSLHSEVGLMGIDVRNIFVIMFSFNLPEE